MKNLLKYSMMFLAVVMGTMTITSCGGEDEDMNQQPPKTNNGNTNQGNGTDVNNDASNGNQEDEADINREDSNGNHENDVNYGSHEYVDLGLSVKWATCNVGANKPEEYGDYFAWGETTTKSTYSWTTYKWCNGSFDNLTKYCTIYYYGTIDNKTNLDKSDDAAAVNWGGSWRMPTRAEQEELTNTSNCTWTLIEVNGVKGYKVTSNKNNNSIFLPLAGLGHESSLEDVGLYGNYWSSSLGGSSSDYAFYMYKGFYYVSRGGIGAIISGTSRCHGFSIRAVSP